jgi:2-polyprenyl-3-methyl-5-hydroxy-6-metoxy-1,4-benzoquinol methylase
MSRIKFVKSVLKGKVLDVGYSVGPLHEEIARERSTVAIDIVVKKPEKTAVKGDATQMPFKSKVFDSLLAGELIEHIEKPGFFLQEGRRVLKTGGLLVITTPNRKSLINRLFRSYEKPAHLSLFSKEELFSLLKKHGFSVEKYTLFPYTEESSEGSRRRWFYPVRKVLHHFLPPSLQEEMVVVARKEKI